MYGEYDRSFAPKLMLTLLHLGALMTAFWLLFGGGFSFVSQHLPVAMIPGNALRRSLLLGAALVYFLRLLITEFYFLRRRMGWSEALTVGAWVWLLHSAFAVLGGINPAAPAWTAILGLVLYLAGSFLNTGSEYTRHLWKQRPENRGHLYTRGFFRYAMHINYFGDVILFSGYAMLTGRAVAFAIPALMAALFIFVNIPMLDDHLAQKYAVEFESYRRNTRKFIPFLY